MLRLLRLLKPIRKYVIISVIVMLLSQIMGLILPLLMSMIVNNGISKADFDYITKTGTIMGICAFAGLGLSVLNAYYTSVVSTRYGKILRQKVFLKVEGLSQCDIDIIGTSSLITRCTNDVKQMQDFILTGIRMILSAPVMLIGGTVMAFIMNAKLALYIFSILPVIALIVFVLMRVIMPLFKKRQKLTDRLNHLVREKITGIRVIRAFNRSEYEDGRFDEKSSELADIALKIARMFAILIPVCIMLAFGAVSLLIWVAAKNIDKMDPVADAVKITNTTGDLQAFVVYMIMIVASLTMAGAMFVIVPRASISAKRIVEVLDVEPMIKDNEASVISENGLKGTVEFKNVDFGYPDADDNVLSDISFTALPGQTTAIIGGTGSGKSTVINLIPRFYDVTGGEVLFDGINVRDINNEELCSKISYIPQSASLFSGTIAENVRFGKEDATNEEVWHALEIAQAADFVKALPDGINSVVSQNGTNLSGGQKQRISIARALIRKAEVYIFDDSFSALDFKTDARLRLSLKKELADSAIIVVAQRVGTILGAEKTVVLDEGRIAGIGTHNELIEDCDVYNEIVKSQLLPDELSDRGLKI